MSLVTYLWHYTLARLLYDDVVRRLGLGSVALVLVICAAVVLARSRRHR